MMKNILMVLCATLAFNTVFAQKFTGKITYEISVVEPGGKISDQKGKSVVFINDSIVRRENDSQLGKQVFITNVNTGKTHLLMHFMGQDYAIIMQTDKFNPDDTSRYNFEKAKGKEKIEGYKCKKMTYNSQGQSLEVFYTDEISSLYNNGSFRHLDGFALSYQVPDQGVVFRYLCTEIINYGEEGTSISEQLFTIPPQYELVTLQKFMEMVKNRK